MDQGWSAGADPRRLSWGQGQASAGPPPGSPGGLLGHCRSPSGRPLGRSWEGSRGPCGFPV
eukprot:8853304-Pyramimonas_sp.AAC.1